MSIYLLRTRMFVENGEHVYKFGRTEQRFRARMAGYPKGSDIYLQLPVFNMNIEAVEDSILAALRAEFTPRLDVGKEYFEGDLREMTDLIIAMWQSQLAVPSQADTDCQMAEAPAAKPDSATIFAQKVAFHSPNSHYTTVATYNLYLSYCAKQKLPIEPAIVVHTALLKAGFSYGDLIDGTGYHQIAFRS